MVKGGVGAESRLDPSGSAPLVGDEGAPNRMGPTGCNPPVGDEGAPSRMDTTGYILTEGREGCNPAMGDEEQSMNWFGSNRRFMNPVQTN